MPTIKPRRKETTVTWSVSSPTSLHDTLLDYCAMVEGASVPYVVNAALQLLFEKDAKDLAQWRAENPTKAHGPIMSLDATMNRKRGQAA